MIRRRSISPRRWARRTVTVFGPTSPEFGFGPLAPGSTKAGREWTRLPTLPRAWSAELPAWTLALHARTFVAAGPRYSSRRPFYPGASRLTVREQFIVGVDLGGTNIAAGAMPTDGTREIAMRIDPDARRRRLCGRGRPHRAHGRGRHRADTRRDRALSERTFWVSASARRDLSTARKESSSSRPNLGWKNFPLRDEVGEPRKSPGDRSTTTPIAPRSANGGAARQRAAAMSLE